MWYQWPLKCSFSSLHKILFDRRSQHYRLEDVELPSETTGRVFVSDVCCVRLHCCAVWSHFLTDHLFWLLKEHLVGHCFHNDEKVEVNIYEGLWVQEQNFYHNRTFTLVPSWNKCINVLSLWILWLFILHSSLFCLRSEIMHSVSLPVTMDSGNSFYSFLDGCTCKESSLKMLIFLLFYQTSCGIPVPHRWYYLHLWWTAATHWIHLCELVVSKIGVCTCTTLISWCAEVTIAVIIMMSHHFVIVQHFMTCHIVMMSSPYTSINWQWILMGGDVFAQNKLNHTMNLAGSSFPLLLLHINLPMSSICLTDSCAICWMLTPSSSATSYQKLKCMMNIIVTG